MLILTEDSLAPLLLLENMMQTCYVPLPDVPVQINLNLQKFGRRNIWHGILPNSFCKLNFNEHIEDAWVSKHITLCTVVLHKMWIERFSMLHESTFSTIRIEDH